jgi:hypothetical protein
LPSASKEINFFVFSHFFEYKSKVEKTTMEGNSLTLSSDDVFVARAA